MTRNKKSGQQQSMFKQEIPEMPEGYYSPGPNPNLRRFAEEHTTPYDPETDDYETQAFSEPLGAKKSTAIYNFHTYWSKKPHDAVLKYVRHFTSPGDVVLDPMCGSGSTALAALIAGRKTIAVDLSPSATFITKNFCTPVSPLELDRAFSVLEQRISAEIAWLYGTVCSRCFGEAEAVYVVYSQTYTCPRCLNTVALFDCKTKIIEGSGTRTSKVKLCPFCLPQGHEEQIGSSLERRGIVPVLFGYECECGCKPRRDSRRTKTSDRTRHELIEKHDLARLAEIEAKALPYSVPNRRMLDAPNERGPWGLLWRPYHEGFDRVSDFYSKRNLWALAALREAILSLETIPQVRDFLLSGFTAILYKCSLMMGYREDGVGRVMSGTYWVPQLIKDINVWRYYREWYGDAQRHLAAKLEVLPPVSELPILISTQSATDLGAISSDTIDYIFTDPPYSWKVQYGESNFLWEAWLDLDTSWIKKEIIVNDFREATEADWASGMKLVLGECFRVLKPGRWLSLCYHDTAEGTWELVQDIATECGFIPDTTDTTLYIDADQKSIKQITAKKIVKRDLVVNFRKPRPGEIAALVTLFGDEDAATFAEKARAILSEALETHPGSPTDRLYDELVSRMVRKGEFERHDFDQLLRSVAEEVNSRWYLLETADQVDEAESAKEAAAAARLEAFMKEYLDEKPEESGVHYSDLFEQYLPVQDKPRRLLADWLPEFFFKTPEGTWRPPANDEERAQKEALRTSGTLRRIKRFARALLEGVPPHDRDRPANVATAADWIRQCRRAGLYDLGRALYEKGGFSFDELSDEGQLEVEEDYQICVRRSG